MDFFNNQFPRVLNQVPADDDATDTEEDSGIVDEGEVPSSSDFPDMQITAPLTVQNAALNNFFNYW